MYDELVARGHYSRLDERVEEEDAPVRTVTEADEVEGPTALSRTLTDFGPSTLDGAEVVLKAKPTEGKRRPRSHNCIRP